MPASASAFHDSDGSPPGQGRRQDTVRPYICDSDSERNENSRSEGRDISGPYIPRYASKAVSCQHSGVLRDTFHLHADIWLHDGVEEDAVAGDGGPVGGPRLVVHLEARVGHRSVPGQNLPLAASARRVLAAAGTAFAVAVAAAFASVAVEADRP